MLQYSAVLIWQNTDQFGNLKAATSAATSLEELLPDLLDMISAVLANAPKDPKFSVDLEYREISAPDGNQVSHTLALPDLEPVSEDQAAVIRVKLDELLEGRGRAVGPWD